MNEWMSEWMSEWMNERRRKEANERTNERTSERQEKWAPSDVVYEIEINRQGKEKKNEKKILWFQKKPKTVLPRIDVSPLVLSFQY